MPLNYPLLMVPHFSPRPWGGERLAGVLGKAVPAVGGPYGEAWELSDHPAGRSTVANGEARWRGRPFGEILREQAATLLAAPAPERYPLLVKYIDAAEDLSVQVHPTDASAPPGERGKTECWYIMTCGAESVAVLGLRPGVGPDDLRRAAAGGRIEECVRRVRIRPGDFVHIPAGTIHATMADTLLCEVQQSSDTTWRLWDWDRRPARALHLDEALAVTDFANQTPTVTHVPDLPRAGWQGLTRNPFFTVATRALDGGEAGALEEGLAGANEHGRILNVVEGGGELRAADGARDGEGRERWTLTAGQTWFLPAALEGLTVRAEAGGLRLLLSESTEIQ